LSTKWCEKVLDDAISKYGLPEIINSDQGSQYTSALWTQHLEKQNIKISMDGKAGLSTISGWNDSGKAASMTTFTSTLALMILNFLRAFKTTSSITTRKHTTQQSKNQISDMRY
jgi:transposase InsO family protein